MVHEVELLCGGNILTVQEVNLLGIEVGNDVVKMALIALEVAHEATYRHSVRTADVAVQIAKKVNCRLCITAPFNLLEDVRDAALLHDIGKLYCPAQILEKRESLTERERENIFYHPIWGERVLLSFRDERLQKLSRFVREHHELPDGSGYPSKLTLDRIAPISRIINIADRYAAMTENRPYRKAVPVEFVIEILRIDIVAFFGEDAWEVIDVLAEFEVPTAPREARTSSGILEPADAVISSRRAAA